LEVLPDLGIAQDDPGDVGCEHRRDCGSEEEDRKQYEGGHGKVVSRRFCGTST
jgi:hypothetical protein